MTTRHSETGCTEPWRFSYLLDNAGEVFFDRLLLERLAGFQLTLAVKPASILNDALLDDAEVAGLAKFGRVIPPGRACWA